jgi:hypothetical protein
MIHPRRAARRKSACVREDIASAYMHGLTLTTDQRFRAARNLRNIFAPYELETPLPDIIVVVSQPGHMRK